MSEIRPAGTPEATPNEGAGYPPPAYAAAMPADLTQAPPATWKRWLLLSSVAGILTGIAWWLAAPGGAFWGSGENFDQWLGRDLTLAGLCVLAGLVAGLLLVRRGAKGSTQATARFLALVAGGLIGSVIAWRVGVFAGDLFQTPPPNLASPSIIFSLRSPSVLLLWPLLTALVVFVSSFIAYGFGPAPRKRHV